VFVLVRITFAIPAGHATKLRITLDGLGRTLLSSRGHLAATVRVVATSSSKPLHRIVKLT
jgi:hypothetical protein